jgi:uncharacterized protein (DUF58 family)
MVKNFKFSLYLSPYLFTALCVVIAIFLVSFTYKGWYAIGIQALVLLGVFTLLDILLLYRLKNGLSGERITTEKFSNGDENWVKINLENHYNFSIYTEIIDELPFQFQARNNFFGQSLQPSEQKTLVYHLRPVQRGEYNFGLINVFVHSPLRLIKRRYQVGKAQMVKVYPSYLQMRKYELLAISDRLSEAGIKKIRKIGHNLEFEQIKEYVRGDDIRTINWKATARHSKLMVNHYQDEKSQQVFAIIDKGRLMQQPFAQMSLLDYAINASLVIANIATLKQDKAGLITFSNQVNTMLGASRANAQMPSILESLYSQKTDFKESNFEKLYIRVKKQITHRSLLILYTNFESLSGLSRQMPYLRRLALHHLLLVVFFENTELKTLIEKPALDTEEIYLQTIAEKFAFEKRQIIKELNRYRIHALLTTPQNLTVDSINKYLEFKSRGLI